MTFTESNMLFDFAGFLISLKTQGIKPLCSLIY
jgi:hypothetical protein